MPRPVFPRPALLLAVLAALACAVSADRLRSMPYVPDHRVHGMYADHPRPMHGAEARETRFEERREHLAELEERRRHVQTMEVNTHMVSVTEKVIEGTVLDIQWLGEHHRYEVLFMLTDLGKLYRSGNSGQSWVEQTPMVTAHAWQHHAGAHPGFFGIITSEADPSVVLFEASEGKHAITEDGGRTYRPIDFHEELGEFKMHPKNKNLILASSLSHRCTHEEASGSCYKNLFVSKDLGRTWTQLTHYVVQFDWAHNLKRGQADHLPTEAIFATVVASKAGHQNFGVWDSRVDLVLTRDLFETHENLVERGNRFLFTNKYLAVAQVAAVGHRVNLVLSSDGAHSFFEAGMPYAMAQHAFTVLDTSEDTIFLHVNHVGEAAAWGHVYISSSTGTNFSLSLPHNRRDANGKCDFEKLQSMEGVYVANYIDNADAMERAEAQRRAADMGQEAAAEQPVPAVEPVIRTVITHDKGGEWKYLTAPTVDAHHEPVRCSPHEGCHLHLHGVTDVFGPFYSTPSAVGLLMATGCIGAKLCFREGEINTYFSRDAGHTWLEVAKGSHIYEFGDHGGLIVMANDEEETRHIKYSWNEGLTWHTHLLSDAPVLVDNIMIEPTSRALVFVVYGTRKDDAGVRTGVVFAIDFSGLHTPQCKGLESVGQPGSDYEHWAPSATRHDDQCLLGHTVMYTRRKQASACYNGLSHEPHHVYKHCQCTERDYECDYGYSRRQHDDGVPSGPCVRVADVPMSLDKLKPAHCPVGAYYHVSDGHRKVAGDTCVGGVQHPLKAFPCHHSTGTSLHGSMVLSLILLLAICMCSLTFCQKQRMNPGQHLPGVGAAVGALTTVVGGSVLWVWSKVPFIGGGGGGGGGGGRRGGAGGALFSGSAGKGFGSGGSGYTRVPAAHSGNPDTFEFDEGDDDGLGFDLNMEDEEPDLLGDSTLNRAVPTTTSLLSDGDAADGGRSHLKRR